MKPDRKILLAVDGSQQAFNAVHYTSKMFPPKQTEINLLYIHTKVPEPFMDLRENSTICVNDTDLNNWDNQVKKNIFAFMEIAHQHFIKEGFKSDAVTISIQDKKVGVARDILYESRKDYDVLVVGRTGGSRFKYFILGSTTNKLAGKVLHIPMVIVGGSPKPQKLFVGFDGSENIMNGMARLASLIDSPKCDVRLCHVLRMLNLHHVEHKPFPPMAEKVWLDENTKQLMPSFEAAKRLWVDAGVAPDNVMVQILDEPYSRSGRLVKEAGILEYGSIVVGRRGLNEVKEFLLGRVSTKVLHLANKSAVWLV